MLTMIESEAGLTNLLNKMIAKDSFDKIKNFIENYDWKLVYDYVYHDDASDFNYDMEHYEKYKENQLKMYKQNYTKLDLNNFVFESVLMHASRNLRLDVMSILIKNSCQVNSKSTYNHETALSHLINNNIITDNKCKRDDIKECVKLLLDNGADFNFYLDKNKLNLQLLHYIFDYKVYLKEYNYLPKIIQYE